MQVLVPGIAVVLMQVPMDLARFLAALFAMSQASLGDLPYPQCIVPAKALVENNPNIRRNKNNFFMARRLSSIRINVEIKVGGWL